MEYTLYISLRSPFARRVRLLMEELRLSYATEVVDVFNPPANFVSVNPLGRVPALRLPSGQMLVESGEIVEYLRGRHSAEPIFDRAGADEARLRYVSGLAAGVMEQVVSAYIEGALRPVGFRHPEWRQDSIDAVKRTLVVLEGELSEPTEGQSGEYYVGGGKVGMWDLDLGAALAYCDLRMGRELVDRHPRLRAYVERLNARDSFMKTVPPA